MNQRGTVIMWDENKGFGFLRPDNPGQKDLFFHFKDMAASEGGLAPYQGLHVSYETAPDRRNPERLRAVSVCRVME